MRLETNLKTIKHLAEEREDENWDFRAYLKRHTDGLDERVHRIHGEVAAQIDCTQCGNCCESLRTALTDADTVRLAVRLGMSTDAFRGEFHDKDEPGAHMIMGAPCPFLKDKRCTVYDDRPEECRDYPHLHKEEFSTRLMGVINNYEMCPIVFNTYERLKEEVWPR